MTFTNRILNRFGNRDAWNGNPVGVVCQRQTPPPGGQSLDANGNAIAPVYKNFTAQISIQEYKGRDRDWLPQGYRESEIVSICSDVTLICQDVPSQVLGDIIPWTDDLGVTRQYLVIHRATADGAFQMDINYWEGYGALIPLGSQPGQP